VPHTRCAACRSARLCWGHAEGGYLPAVGAQDAARVCGCCCCCRVGPEKCLTVRWPRKDANEVLLEDGPHALKACLDAAEAVPIRGLFHFDAFRKEVRQQQQQALVHGQQDAPAVCHCRRCQHVCTCVCLWACWLAGQLSREVRRVDMCVVSSYGWRG
jgi:hypothetical protein